MREYGNVRISKASATGFWCNFVDLADDELVEDIISQVQADQANVIKSVKSYKQVSTYYLTNINNTTM